MNQIIILLVIIAVFQLANLALKGLSHTNEIKVLQDEIAKKDTLINIYTQNISTELNNKIVDIYRIKTDPDRWINLYPGYIRLILEESIYVDKRFHQTIRDYINDHPDTKDLPGCQLYINK